MATRVRLYSKGKLVSEDFPVEEISEHLQNKDNVVWLDILSPQPTDFALISQEFNLHDLAVEDALHDGQRPKLDRYDEHLFLTAYDVMYDRHLGRTESHEVDVFIMKRALITVHKSKRFDIDDVVKRWDNNKELAHNGVAFLLWGLLDHIIDGHFEVVQQLDDGIEKMEDILFDEQRRGQQHHMQRLSYEMRKSLVNVRRVVLPMREVVNTLFRRDLNVIPAAMQPYYQDVYDHVLRASEQTESLRDLVTTIFETNLSLQDNRLNEIMKKLTGYAAIIAVPTAVTGFYGQNVPYPGFGKHAGFVWSIGIMVAIAGLLFAVFKRKDWI